MTQSPSPSGSDGLSTVVADAAAVGAVVDAPTAGSTASNASATSTVPVVLLPYSPVGDPARGSALARAFAARGWDVCVYCATEEATAAEAIVDMVGALGRRATVWPMDLSAVLSDRGAEAWLAHHCHWPVESAPRCVVTAPLTARRERIAVPVSASSGSNTSAFDAAAMDASVRANVSLPIALTHALAAVWQATRKRLSDDGSAPSAVGERTAGGVGSYGQRGQRGHQGHPDVVAIHLLDDLHELIGADGSALAFGLSQSALHSAIPALAHALAPWMRVVAVQTPLWTPTAGRSDSPTAADVADAVCYLARAATITGSTLRVDAGVACAEPVPDVTDRRTKASFDAADTASECAGG